jgi:hypothetical protein
MGEERVGYPVCRSRSLYGETAVVMVVKRLEDVGSTVREVSVARRSVVGEGVSSTVREVSTERGRLSWWRISRALRSAPGKETTAG